MTKEEILIEYVKCAKDSPYALRTYLETFDNTRKRYVPFELFDDQINLIKDYEEHDENIAVKYRQAGVSTATAAWCSKKLIFANKNSPEKILVAANKLDTALELVGKIRAFVTQWPSWMGVKIDDSKKAAKHYKLTNGCEVKAVATSKDALRSYTPTILIFDEAAYIEAGDDFWAAAMAALSTGGKCIVISTPNGFDPIYYEIYDQSVRGLNNFKISELTWYKDPRYTKDLSLIKVDDMVDYILRKEDFKNSHIVDYSKIPPRERNYAEIKDLIADGYLPYSSWYESMVKKLKYDKRKVSQELNCNFLGSGDNVINIKDISYIRDKQVEDPISKLLGGSLWVWKEPVKGHRYVMGIDVSRGDSEDSSTFQIVDVDEGEQVVEFLEKVPPDVLAEIAFKWAKTYNCFVVVDITGGMGVATARKLQELGYKNLYYDGVKNSVWNYNAKMDEKVPGINFNNKRVLIVASLEESIRHRFKIKSKRLLNELRTFVYINGRPDHAKGKHDDLIMSLSIALYAMEQSFGKLERMNEETKVLLDAWKVNEHQKLDARSSQYFNPNVYFTNENSPYRNSPSRADYEEYGWLFGK